MRFPPSQSGWGRGKSASSRSLGSWRRRFFFSSRRRHTRWTGDWSSDVCSSDLEALAILRRAVRENPSSLPLLVYEQRALLVVGDSAGAWDAVKRILPLAPASKSARSEERRVGKGCRYRWLAGR